MRLEFTVSHKPFWYFLIGITASVLLAAAGFCLFYLLSDYASLKSWYLGLNPCIYHASDWEQDFFTPETKARGNLFCVFALVGIVSALSYLTGTLRRKKAVGVSYQKIVFKESLLALTLAGLLCFFWYLGNSIAKPAPDEIFSAIHCSGMHPFQTMSYYMVPNNHLFFNLVNALIFPYSDTVFTGRILSLFAYLLTGILLFYIFRALKIKAPLAFLAAAVCALQFCVWGFGFQARGYALYTLAGWVAVATLFAYLHQRKDRYLVLHAAACVIGYAALPTFLYLHAATVVFVFISSLRSRQWHKKYWLGQAFIALFVYLFHLPVLGFSGLGAFIANDYVRPLDMSVMEFIPEMIPVLGWYGDYCFSGLPFASFLFIIPLGLLAARRDSLAFRIGVFYITLLIVLLVIFCLQRRMPFQRNLAPHFSFALVSILYTVYLGVKWASEKLRLPVALGVLFHLGLAGLGYHFLKKDLADVHWTLYFSDTKARYATELKILNSIPKEGRTAFSDDSFILYYLAQQNGYDAALCPAGNESYFVMKQSERLPDDGPYRLHKGIAGYFIYEKFKTGP